MKVNLEAPILDLDGSPLEHPTEKSPLTIRKAITDSLLIGRANDNPDGAEKFRRWELARQIHGTNEINLTAEQASMVKKLVGEIWSPGVVGPVWEAIEKGEA